MNHITKNKHPHFFRIPLEEAFPEILAGETAQEYRKRVLIVDISVALNIITLDSSMHYVLLCDVKERMNDPLFCDEWNALNEKIDSILEQYDMMCGINPADDWEDTAFLLTNLFDDLFRYWHDRISLHKEIGYYYQD